MFKKIGSIMLGLLLVLGLAACADTANSNAYVVSVDINPSIEFVVDGEDTVVSVKFLNEDAEVLFAETDFIGMNIDDAVELFVQIATEAGFIDPESEENAVLITVMGQNEGTHRQRIKERLIKHFARQYIKAEILTEEFTQEDLVAQAEDLGVSPGKLAMALLIQASDETLVLEELLELPVKDLVALVKEGHQEAMKEFNAEKLEEFRVKREEMFENHRARLDEYIENHPELTQEQIDALEQFMEERAQKVTRQRWQERMDQWKQHRDNRTDEEPDDTEEPNETDQTS